MCFNRVFRPVLPYGIVYSSADVLVKLWQSPSLRTSPVPALILAYRPQGLPPALCCMERRTQAFDESVVLCGDARFRRSETSIHTFIYRCGECSGYSWCRTYDRWGSWPGSQGLGSRKRRQDRGKVERTTRRRELDERTLAILAREHEHDGVSGTEWEPSIDVGAGPM